MRRAQRLAPGLLALLVVAVVPACGGRGAALDQSPEEAVECVFDASTGKGDPGNDPSCPSEASPALAPT